MKDLYLAIGVLCFLVAIMIYCLNKSIKVLGELYDFWKKYKQAGVNLEETIKEFYRKK